MAVTGVDFKPEMYLVVEGFRRTVILGFRDVDCVAK